MSDWDWFLTIPVLFNLHFLSNSFSRRQKAPTPKGICNGSCAHIETPRCTFMGKLRLISHADFCWFIQEKKQLAHSSSALVLTFWGNQTFRKFGVFWIISKWKLIMVPVCNSGTGDRESHTEFLCPIYTLIYCVFRAPNSCLFHALNEKFST